MIVFKYKTRYDVYKNVTFLGHFIIQNTLLAEKKNPNCKIGR